MKRQFTIGTWGLVTLIAVVFSLQACGGGGSSGTGEDDNNDVQIISPNIDDEAEDTDTDGDGIGDAEDDDDDGDGTADTDETDTDGDGTPDDSDDDDDGDGISDGEDDDDDGDGTPDAGNTDPVVGIDDPLTDTDGDGTPDESDTDDDNDGTLDESDAFPLDAIETTDTDGDGTGDNADADDDGDGTADSDDAFPLDAAETTDTDGDGYGANTDCDDDTAGTNPGAEETCNDGIDNDCDGATNCLFSGTIALSDIVSGGDGVAFEGGAYDNAQLGTSISRRGDFDNDGYDDILIGAPGYESNTGAAILVDGASVSEASYDLSACADDVCALFSGATESDYAGVSVAFTNMNGDSYYDITVGAWGYDTDASNEDTGAVYVMSGSTLTSSFDGTTLGSIGKKFVGATAGDKFGFSVANAGNVNGTSMSLFGYSDMIVGAVGVDNGLASSAGASYLIYGSLTRLSSGFFYGSSTVTVDCSSLSYCAEFLGTSQNDMAAKVSPAGDLNDDGYPDFFTGADGYDSYTGAAYLVAGGSTAYSGSYELATDASAAFTGVEGELMAGVSSAKLGDVNGDGIDDAIVGGGSIIAMVFGADDCGSGATLITGSADGFSGSYSLGDMTAVFEPEDATDCAGVSVAGARDVNGDGLDDILIGAPFADANGVSNTGAAYLFYGREDFSGTISLADADAVFTGIAENDAAGYTVQGVGDINNDGFDDFAIGAPFEDGDAYSNVGAVYLVYGAGE